MSAPTRRWFLAAVAASTLGSLAGCQGLREADDEGTANEPTDDGDDGSSEPVERDSLETEAVEIVDALADGRIEDVHDRVAPTWAEALNPGVLEQFWMGYTAIGGPFERVDDAEETTRYGYDAVELDLEFERGEHAMVLLFDDGLVDLLPDDEYRPPTYAADDADRDSIVVERSDCQMAGTLTRPSNADDAPGVVLVHGSGPTDAEHTIGATKIFEDLALGLAEHGVATLQYDKRTWACEGGLEPAEQTVDAVAVDDALEAATVVREADGVDPDRVVIVGLSLGGLLTPRILERDPDLAGGVALAAPIRSFQTLIGEQFAYLAQVGEYERPEVAAQYEEWHDRIDDLDAGEYDDGEVIFDYPGALYRSLDEYDHVETARELDRPLYFLQGERDYQVTVDDDFAGWQEALADRPDTAFDSYDELNHLFTPGEGPSVQFEYLLANSVDRRVVDDVADWIATL